MAMPLFHPAVDEVTMNDNVPSEVRQAMSWSWNRYAREFDRLARTKLGERNVDDWLVRWSRLSEIISEVYARLYVATSQNTTDKKAEASYHTFLERIMEPAEAADQKLKEMLLASGLAPSGFEIPLQKIRTSTELFREANLPLFTRERKLGSEYDRIIGAQTVQWEGKEITIAQLAPVMEETDRKRRERAWRLAAERRSQDSQSIGELWSKFMKVRLQQARNADFEDYRSFRWKLLHRYDYTPQDCLSFHQAIEKTVVPAVQDLYTARRERMGLDQLRPWDLGVDPVGRPPLRPFKRVNRLIGRSSRIFHRVDPELGDQFDIMAREGLLDLANRKGKAPGGYCIDFDVAKRPFIFMNAVGLHGDVETVLHESGHSFHTFATARLPYLAQRGVGMEFAEVASMAMELLASPYLSASQGGFYTTQEAARARIDHLEGSIMFWPYMAVVDAFQHWVYENPESGRDIEQCDIQWEALARRFMPGVDWSGLEGYRRQGWQQKLHIHTVPFYYVEYGLAQLGAIQVWANALKDQSAAVTAYRQALALGGTVPLPELFKAAGARLAFDSETLGEAVSLMVRTIEELEQGLDGS